MDVTKLWHFLLGQQFCSQNYYRKEGKRQLGPKRKGLPCTGIEFQKKGWEGHVQETDGGFEELSWAVA